MKVTVVGTGYVGLVTGACLTKLGHRVACVDVDRERVVCISRGEAPFYEPGLSELIQAGLKNKKLSATGDLSQALSGSAVSIIAVGTPSKGERIDLSYIAAAASQLGQALRQLPDYHVVTVKSTVVPGTTDTLVRQTLETASGRKVGDFGLCMNPEFLREGFAVDDFMNPDRIVIGQWDKRSGDVLAELYAGFDCPVLRLSLRNAEMVKYASNSLLATLISFSNEFAGLCEATPNTDVDVVMDALHLDRRLSPLVDGNLVSPGILTYLRAGAGFGGSCLPKDVKALRVFAQENRIPTPLLDAVMQINNERPGQIVSMLEVMLAESKGRTIAVLGLAFKPGTDDLRDSPALGMVERLLKRGMAVRAYDPLAMPAAKPLIGDRVELCSDAETLLRSADAAIVATAWPEFVNWDWPKLAGLMRQPIIIDARNAFRKKSWPAGITYVPIGLKTTQAAGK